MKASARRFAADAMKLLPRILEDKETPPTELARLFNEIGAASVAVESDRKALSDEAFALLERSSFARSAVLTIRGEWLIAYASDARPDASSQADPKAWTMFNERIAQARSSLEEAWSLDVTNAQVASLMILVEGSSDGNRDAMERWYARAVQADPENIEAAERKLLFLHPDMHGSAAEMLDFARGLAARPGTAPRLATLLADVHWTLAKMTPRGTLMRPRPEYFTENMPAVWNDVRQAYATYLERVPHARLHRTRYAVMAAWCGQWAEARRHFERLGEEFSRQGIDAAEIYELRSRAYDEAGAPDGQS
jgi:hypothetical protein